MINPKEIQQFPSGDLGVIWEDGHESIFLPQSLRKHCPCAMCNQDPQRGLGIHPGRFTLKKVRSIGQYGLGLSWADGHDTGIYAFDELRKLCECEKCCKNK